ncbi:sensor histidine kinase [Reichenbachiella ulvae]|uniref:histidine kinase n=1 Tax=Reichenbachiella ulvae TaxID=2980104 RepID=A0ABT3CW99_9BACT|nr:HAMP domain-containing sensor histidine kinase [Reichenbachiella ulvae]MCV9387841.1 HAMP domain-containing histidine kinase [Reichenbachiella ulvae]
MSRTAFRILIILAVVSIAGILLIQLFWMKRAFDIRNQQFDRNVKSALLNVNEALSDLNAEVARTEAIEQISSNYFVVNINNKISPATLEGLLLREFEQRSITEGFEYGIFDCSNSQMVYGEYLELGDSESEKPGMGSFPELNKDEYYFGVYFPNKTTGLVSQMGIWIYSSVTLLVVVLFFGFSLFLISRQKRLSEVQKDFINNMTHEFRTPLSTLAVSAEVLKSPEILSQPDRLSTYAEIVERETFRLQGQVDRVLQMANVSKEQIELKKESVDLSDLMQELKQRYEVANPSAELRLDFEGDLPLVHGDALHLSNVLSNLLDNAIKYSGEHPFVLVRGFQRKEELILEFEDQGKGISSDQLKMIFQKFYRVPTGNVHDVKGFGLGLYYCKMVMEAHGGKITAKSQLGKGTTVTLSLPIK